MWRKIGTTIKFILVILLFVVITAPEWPAFGNERYRLDTLIGLRLFDFVGWELDALQTKAQAMLAGGQSYMDEAARKQYVLDYLALLAEARSLERGIEAVYADPSISDHTAATQAQQAELSVKRAELARRQPIAEAIVQDQVAAILAEEGFDLFGATWPPVQMHMTPLPQILIVSPRSEIRQAYNIPLVPGLSTPDKDSLETGVYDQLDMSALVVPIGGLGIYPSMILETSDINFLADVVAHEWAHHWLTLRPVGLSYGANPTMRTINETIASIIGEEVGARVVERYYPEFVPVPPEEEPAPAGADEPGPSAPPPFNFRAEMAETRTQVDELLAAGRIPQAEAYMEARRRFFVDNGYNIRKLNQAYFAFYGAYADTPGATGSDPVGPAVVSVRENSPSLRDFMDNVAFVTSLEDLQAVLARLVRVRPKSTLDFPSVVAALAVCTAKASTTNLIASES